MDNENNNVVDNHISLYDLMDVLDKFVIKFTDKDYDLREIKVSVNNIQGREFISCEYQGNVVGYISLN